MACPKNLGRIPFSVMVDNTNDQWLALTPFVGVTGADDCACSVTVTRITGNARVTAAYQLAAAREEVPDAPAASTGGYATTTVTKKTTVALGSVTDKFLGRFGILASLSGGSTPGYVEGYCT